MVWWTLQNRWGENVIESVHISLNLFIFCHTLSRNQPLPSLVRGCRLFSGFRQNLHLLHTQSGQQPQEGCRPKQNYWLDRICQVLCVLISLKLLTCALKDFRVRQWIPKSTPICRTLKICKKGPDPWHGWASMKEKSGDWQHPSPLTGFFAFSNWNRRIVDFPQMLSEVFQMWYCCHSW